MREDRLRAIEERLRFHTLTGWILVPGPSLRYLTGWSPEPSERILMVVFPRGGEPFLFVPHLEAERAVAATGIRRTVTYRDESGPAPALARAFGPWGTSRPAWGAEFRAMRLLERAGVDGVCPRSTWLDIGEDLAVVRVVKDASELEAIVRAAGLAEAVMEEGRRAIRPGATELEVRRAVQRALLERDSASPFGVLVASGPRTALPHAEPTDRVIAAGDLVWIDLGATCDGYCSDITRTFAVGDPGDELRAVYRAVLEGQEAGCAAARPGLAAEEVDRAARSVIAQAGYGAYFTHRTGHGLGLEDHEAPFLVDGNAEPLRPGMVFTVEPGAYVPGRGGVRIEDDLVVEAAGCRRLTDYRRDWWGA